MAVDGGGRALTYNGRSWSAPAPIFTATISSVSCTSASFCAAVTGFGVVLTYNGSSWSAPVNVGALGINSVSCASASFCAAVSRGYALTYNGSSWSAPARVATSQLDSVSCPSASFCVAVDQIGNAVTYSGGGTPPLTPLVTKCIVPRLKGKTLAQARKLLAKAHCKLGKVTKPKHHTKHRQVVVSQKPGARKSLPSGTKIAIRLG